jgi:hypothetical protein
LKFLSAYLLAAFAILAQSTSASPAETPVSAAIEKGLLLVQEAARNYPDNRDCFSCHHQTLPMLAMVTARGRGFKIDDVLLIEQAEFTREFYKGRVKDMNEGKGVGGRGMTAAYALWAFDLAKQNRDDVTDALVHFLEKTQQEDGSWNRQSNRPPLEETNITATYLAAYYIDKFADDSESVATARAWVAGANAVTQEGRNFQLLAALDFGAAEEMVAQRQSVVLKAQHDDGGWGQNDEMQSDAYATGQTVFILTEVKKKSPELVAAIDRGIAYLLKTQEPDGSWHVVSRSKPIQKMFDNGDPHGKDQFISTPATAWAVAALAATLTNAESEPPKVRIEAEGFDASDADISKLLGSATLELWKHFPGYALEPIVVVRGHEGPITLFDRNLRKEIVVRLDTGNTYWSQYAYQWSHEFCHVLCGFRSDGRDNKWFEETLCELASVYTLRRMNERWEKNPPYPHWKEYRKSLSEYADNVIKAQEKLMVDGLAGFYQKHKKTLRENATKRDLNGAMAVALLPLFEKEPEHWNAVRYLNTTPAVDGLSLRDYFLKWHKASPEKHRDFILRIGRAYGIVQ